MKKKLFNEEETRNIINDYLNNVKIYDLCEKYKIGKLRLHEILDENQIKQRKDLKIKNDDNVITDKDYEKYPLNDDIEYVVYDEKNPNFHTTDIKNLSGVITRYIKEEYGVELPSVYKRNKYFLKTGNYWWEEYLKVKQEPKIKKEYCFINDVSEIDENNKSVIYAIKCPYCDWFTTDVYNKSGAIEKHISNVHKTHYVLDNRTEDEYVVCQICGAKLTRIDNKHLKKHNITLEEYKKQYGKNSTVCKALHETLSKRKDVLTVEERQEDFIRRGKEVHKDENLDFSHVKYINNYTKVEIIDNDLKDDGTPYGSYMIAPYQFLRGVSHPLKKGVKIATKKLIKDEELIKRFNEVHANEDLDYSQMEYKGMNQKIKVISHDKRPNGTEYGEFWITPNNLLKGSTHPELGKFNGDNKKRGSLEKVIAMAYERRKDMDNFSFEHAVYINNKTKLQITCKIHGDFWMTPLNFINGEKCPKCSNKSSSKETEIYEMICECLGSENVKCRDRSVLGTRELDIYVPSLKFAVEYNGLHWHTTQFGCDENYHINKTMKCEEKGIILYQVFEDEYLNNSDLIISRIKHAINMNFDLPPIDGRKCDVRIIDNESSNEFLNMFGLKDKQYCDISIGAFYNEKLIGVVMFKNIGDMVFELPIIFTNIYYRCRGVIGKMFNFFINNIKFNKIISSIDRRYLKSINKNILVTLGFKFIGYSKPNVFLTPNHKVRIDINEAEIGVNYFEIFDCGMANFEYGS